MSIKRRTLMSGMAGTAAALAAPALAQTGNTNTKLLRFIPQADLSVLDPMWTTAYVTRNHGFMVFDTLFGLDSKYQPSPQMLAGFNTENDGKLWTLGLRSGLKFHDGTPVRAQDCVASINRWSKRDAFGGALMAATDELSAKDDQNIVFRLKRPFPLLPQALAKPTNLMAAIMPERLTSTPPGQLTEMVGSGPFRFVANERVPGARNVYAKFADYVPRDGAPDFCAGARIAHFDRVEWLTTPDPATQAAALQSGEVDWVEQPVMDLVPSLRRDHNLKVEVVETTGLIGVLRFNQLFPPFDNAAIRRAALKAVNQRDFMEAVAGEADPGVINDHIGFFAPSSPYASDAGMDIWKTKYDLAVLKQEVMAAGYKGEKVVFLGAADVPRISAICQVGADMLSKIGLNVDYVSTDWGTVVQRSTRKQPIDQGGWSMFGSMWGGYDWYSPAGDAVLRGNGQNAWFGWPIAPKLESLRDQWLRAPDMASQKAIAAQIQVQAFEDVPALPVGLYYQPVAYRNNLTDMLKGLILFTNVRRV